MLVGGAAKTACSQHLANNIMFLVRHLFGFHQVSGENLAIYFGLLLTGSGQASAQVGQGCQTLYCSCLVAKRNHGLFESHSDGNAESLEHIPSILALIPSCFQLRNSIGLSAENCVKTHHYRLRPASPPEGRSGALPPNQPRANCVAKQTQAFETNQQRCNPDVTTHFWQEPHHLHRRGLERRKRDFNGQKS